MEIESLPNWFDEEMYRTECTSEENIVLDVMKHWDEFEEEMTKIDEFVEEMTKIEAAMKHYDEFGHDGCKKSPATAKGSNQERKKVVRWTKEEHERFLVGLENYGKGHWKNIARYFVRTKTPTQVASHAQKYFLKQKLSGGKDNKRRSSIHDITTDNLTEPTTNSGQDKPLLFNESLMPIVQPEGINHLIEEPLMEVFNPNYESLMTNVQPEGINHLNEEPLMEVFNPNYESLMTNVQPEGINHLNEEPLMEVFNPNYESLITNVQPEGISHLNEEPLMEVFNPNYESLMTNVQPEGINHHNVEPLMEVFNPNYDEMFMFPSSDIYSETLKFQGQQDLDKCLFHHAYAHQNAQGFGITSNDFNKDVVFGFW
ncbi:SANT/Myb domain [Sesbania bispinosa]|nr:SANT/Myb domain [Sesbania bispinosa]